MTNAVIPVIKSIFLCDDVQIDQDTNKLSVRGLFNTLRTEVDAGGRTFVDEFCVFAEFVGGVVRASVRVEIVHAASNNIVYRTATRALKFRGRQTTLGVCLRIAGFAVSETGVYFVELYCNDRFMDDRAVHITVSDEYES